MTSQCGEATTEAGALRVEGAALEMFQLAALLLGNEEEAVGLVEQTIAGLPANPCANSEAAEQQARPRLLDAALQRFVRSHPAAFAEPPAPLAASNCLETDDLTAAGMSASHLSSLLEDAGMGDPGREGMRKWIDELAPALRVIFILRAVAGQDALQAAETLGRSGAGGAELWGSAEVGTAYRQALCSLASSLVASKSAAALA